jgi:hypothetical protein
MRRKFSRPLGERRYKKLFVIGTEGSKTEPEYFARFNNPDSVVRVHCLKAKHSSPLAVLAAIKKYIKNESLRAGDEAWLVVDRDEWRDEHLNQLHEWSQEKPNYGLAVSNPRFEIWVALHFEDGHQVPKDKLDQFLKKQMPGYKKGTAKFNFSKDQIRRAIRVASNMDRPCCSDWPRTHGTTVYKLVAKIYQI